MDTQERDFEGNGSLLIVDDDPEVCTVLEKYMAKKGIRAKSVADPLKILEHARENTHDVILLDVVMPHVSGLELIPEIKASCPETKIIIMTGYADKDMAIASLRAGAFDFLEKPIDYSLVFHAVSRALDAQRAERQVKKTHEKLKQSRDRLLAYKKRVDELNRQLVENNQALSALAKNIELTRKECSREIVLKIRSLIVPVLERLRKDINLKSHYEELNTITRTVETMTADLAAELELSMLLTPHELRIASLIRNGLTTEAIARHLFLATGTIKTHRKNIRKKLGINHTTHSLKDYLRSEFTPS